MQNREPVFELINVSYDYLGRYPALKDISMSVKVGECISILGANGSGKSTLLKILDGLIFPSSGIVKAFGVPLSEASLDLNKNDFSRYFRSRVGLVFQDSDAQLFSPLVWEEVAFGPLQMDLPRIEVEKRVDDVLSLLQIRHLKDRSPYALSEGEKRKVAIASVLSIGSDVLILDEPSAGLDPLSQAWLEDFLIEMSKIGKTIITATHDLGLAENISERSIILNGKHEVTVDGLTEVVLSDWDLLLKSNLVHEHIHKHGKVIH